MDEAIIARIKSDIELRPQFFELICKGFMLGLSDSFTISDNERIKFQRSYYNTLLDLTEKLQLKVKPNEVLDVIEEVSKFYLTHVGRIAFENYKPDDIFG